MRSALVSALFVVVTTACGAAPAAHPTGSSGIPFAIDHVLESFDGTATDVVQVPGYTYVAVDVGGGDVRWAASLHKELPVGARVHVRSFGKQRNFKSPKLGRVFPELRFAVVSVQQ